mgnify:CR=1 FL=1
MYVYFNEWTDDIAQFFDEGPSGYGIIENPRKARLKKRFGLGAENEYVKTGKVKGFSIEGYFADKMEKPKDKVLDM